MRYHEIIELYEARMNPNALKRFLNSPEADGILAGFEAELIFSDRLELGSTKSMNERVSDIDDACDFFNYTNDAQLRSRLEEDYSDYCTETLMAEFKNDEEEMVIPKLLVHIV